MARLWLAILNAHTDLLLLFYLLLTVHAATSQTIRDTKVLWFKTNACLEIGDGF